MTEGAEKFEDLQAACGVRNVYATNGMQQVNQFGDAVDIGSGDDGRYSVNVFSLVRSDSYALIDRDELTLLRDAIDAELQRAEPIHD